MHRIGLGICLATILAVTSAPAGIVPLDNRSQLYSKAVAGTVTDSDFAQASGTADWDGLVLAEANDEHGTFCGSDALLAVQMTASSLHGDGVCRGIGGGIATFHHQGYGDLRLLFLVNETQEYTADLFLTQGNLPPGMGNSIGLYDLGINAYWRLGSYGSTTLTGRIAPGSYWLLARTSYVQTTAGGSSDAFDVTMDFTPCTNPLVSGQPQDQTVSPGATIDLQLTPASTAPAAAASGTNSYQWRKNLQDLTDGGRISGAHTPRLTISAAVLADSGRYDCVVTQGAIVEPSRQAVVTVTASSAVDPPLAASDVRLSAPWPNPSRGGVRCEFALERPTRVSLSVHDALGRRVKSLLTREAMPTGRFAVDWPGTNDDGVRLPSGIYFIHLDAGGVRLARRAALITGTD